MSRLPKNVVKRGNCFQLRIRVNGRVERESLGRELTAEARQRAAQLRQKYLEERRNGIQKPAEQAYTFESYAEDHWFPQHVANRRRGRNTARDTEARMQNHAFPVLGRLRLDQVTLDRIAALIPALREPGPQRKRPLADRTINQVLADIRACLYHAERHGYVERAPKVSELMLRVKRGQPQGLTLEERAAVLDETKTPEERFVIEFAMETGIRRGELASLHWRYVRTDGKDPELIVVGETSKSGESRIVPLSPYAVSLLEEQKRRSAGVLVSPLGYDQLGRLVERIKKRTGIAWHWHRLRHTQAQGFLDAGGSVEALSKILGHKEITTTAIYARPSDRLVRNEARRVWMEQNRLFQASNGSQNGSQS